MAGRVCAEAEMKKPSAGPGLITLDSFLFSGLWRGVDLAGINGMRPHY